MSSRIFARKSRKTSSSSPPNKWIPDIWESFVRRLYYLSGDMGDKNFYLQLKVLLDKVDQDHSTHGNHMYYLATAAEFFGPTVERLAEVGLMQEDNQHWRRVVIEKPFGHDLESARLLNQQLLRVASEKQIYRIDHYLGKETVQNILALRFANGIFEPVWNRRYIDHIQISVTETVGVEKRGGYYDKAGALRDMVPNHIMQLISLTAMEPPVSFRADSVRDEQAKILHAIQPMSSEDVLIRTVRGQYGEGIVGGERTPAYRREPGVPPDSKTETFVAMKLLIDNWRWADVPFYLRTGKHLHSRSTSIVIQFRRAPFVLFRDTPVENLMPNQLVLHIQPEEGISLRFAAKEPGPAMRLGAVNMSFEYNDYFKAIASTGYERLLHDCMIGDATLFQRADMVEAGGASSARYWTSGKHYRHAIFPTTPPAPGARKRPTTCSNATAATGGIWRNDSRRRYWRNPRAAGVFRCRGRPLQPGLRFHLSQPRVFRPGRNRGQVRGYFKPASRYRLLRHCGPGA